MDLERLITGKLAARISIFGIHIAAFGAAYSYSSLTVELCVVVMALSIAGIWAETILSGHYSELVKKVPNMPSLKPGLRNVFRAWYLFSLIFWIYKAIIIGSASGK